MNDDIDEVKKRLNIVDYIQSYVPLRKAGASWKGLCPFHQEKSPSFTVNEERQTYKCFGCNEAGDVLDFLQKMEHLTFPEALQMLADRVGIILDKRKTPEQYAQEKDAKSRLYRLNRVAADVFHKLLVDSPNAASVRAYLTERGLTDTTIRAFRLGFAPPTPRGTASVLERFLTQRGFTSEERRQAGQPERFHNRLMFPLFDVLGHPIGFTGRTLDPNDQPKYLNTPETPIFKKSRVLYPLDQAKEAIKATGRVIVVEGQMDVLLAHQLGTHETVATSGTALTLDHLAIVKRYTSRILFAFDSDQAGIEATRKAILLAYDLELEPSVIVLPPGIKDVGELAVMQPTDWTLCIDQALPAIAWQLAIGRDITPEPDSAVGKKAIGRLVLPLVARIQDPIERAHWIQVVARKLAISEKTVSEALERFIEKSRSISPRPSSDQPGPHAQPVERVTPHELLLGLLVVFPEQVATVATKIEPKDFGEGTRAARLAKTLAVCYTQHGSIDQTRWIEQLTKSLSGDDAKWLGSLITQIEHLHPVSDSTAIGLEIRAGFDRLHDQTRERQKETVAQQIQEAEARGDRETTKRLMAELQKLFKD